MSQKTIRLQSYKTGTKHKLFEIEVNSINDMFIGDIQESEKIDSSNISYPENNKYNYFDYLNKQMVHNIYRLEQLLIKNMHYNIKKSQFSNSISDYIDSYTPFGLDYIDSTITDSNLFLLSDLTTRSGRHIGVVDYDHVAESSIPLRYVYGMKDQPNNTYLYNTSGDIDADPTKFEPKYILKNIAYNNIVHIPVSDKRGFYDNKTILGEHLVCKNAYDYDYSMKYTPIVHGASVSANGANNRKYIGIDTCGDITYLVYRNNLSYTTNTGIYNTSSVTLSANTVIEDVANTYQHIEVINSMNRYNNQIGHKSNLYSLNIQNAGLNTSSMSEINKNKIKKSIVNSIRNITKNMMPASTQLYNVYWTGE